MAREKSEISGFCCAGNSVGILTFLAILGTMSYFYSGRVTLDGWIFHVVPTAILVGLFSLLLWKRPKTMAPAEDEETKADSAMARG